jgi:hypothetical protein
MRAIGNNNDDASDTLGRHQAFPGIERTMRSDGSDARPTLFATNGAIATFAKLCSGLNENL